VRCRLRLDLMSSQGTLSCPAAVVASTAARTATLAATTMTEVGPRLASRGRSRRSRPSTYAMAELLPTVDGSNLQQAARHERRCIEGVVEHRLHQLHRNGRLEDELLNAAHAQRRRMNFGRKDQCGHRCNLLGLGAHTSKDGH
jgi:hypothetical protein